MKKLYLVAISVLIAISIGSVVYNGLIVPEKASKPPVLVVRIDDIQDYAFREAQLFLLNYSLNNQVPLSLAVIPKVFGEDLELVETTKQAIKSGSEVLVHGWEHANLTKFTFDEQKVRLLKAKQNLELLLNTETKVLVPPMFSYNDATIKAMEETDYAIVSGIAEFHARGYVSDKIMSIPATIELSDYSNETWQMKAKNVIMTEVENSIEIYGYAMIVTHPQEFIKGGNLDHEIAATFDKILRNLNEKFSFTTIEDINGHLQQNLKHQID